MQHLKITLECTGDVLTAISTAQRIAKATADEYLYLNFKEGFSLHIRAKSDVLDLFEIYRLKRDSQAKS